MAYKIVPIGSSFSTKDIDKLARQLSEEQSGGWELSFVFPVTRRTCLIIEQTTYLVVLRRDN